MWNKDPNSETLRDVQNKLVDDIAAQIIIELTRIVKQYNKEKLTNEDINKAIAISVINFLTNGFNFIEGTFMLIEFSRALAGISDIRNKIEKKARGI